MPCPSPLMNLSLVAAAAPAGAPCSWCQDELPALARDKHVRKGDSGAPVKKLQEHLKKFGMTIELGEWKNGKFEESADVKNGAWGGPATRAVRMFASHPVVGAEAARVITSDGKSIGADLVAKFQEWCRGGVISPQNYWELKGLHLKAGDLDAAGSHAAADKQTVLHDFVVQIEKDLSLIGFAAHADSLCSIGATHKPTGAFASVHANGAGHHDDKHLTDVPYLVRKFQRQAQWLWRMTSDGSHLPDVSSSDPSTHTGPVNGEVDEATARVLHHWATHDLHQVINKFPLVDLEWPPDSGAMVKNADSGGNAKVRSDAQEDWDRAAREIAALNGTIAGPYASTPRSWKGGKTTSPGASAFSWHYSALAVDLSQGLTLGDASISSSASYGLEKEAATTKAGAMWFRLWCWANPQPPAPATPADDEAQPFLKYRNRNIKPKHVKGTPNETKVVGAPTAASTLYFATTKKNTAGTDVLDVTAREGWYVDLSAIFEKHGWHRIPRHGDWLTNSKAWEYWHYQYQPADPPGATAPPTFGEYLQIFGVHELRLRAVGWSAHEDIDHAIG